MAPDLLHLRPVSTADTDELQVLIDHLITKEVDGIGFLRQRSASDIIDESAGIFRDHKVGLWIVEHNRSIAGVTGFLYDAGRLRLIYYLYQSNSGQGLGRIAAARALQYAINAKLTIPVVAEVQESNLPAIRIARAIGMKEGIPATKGKIRFHWSFNDL